MTRILCAPGVDWSRREGGRPDEEAWRPLATWALMGTIGAVYVLQLATRSYVTARAGAFEMGNGPFPGLLWPGPFGSWAHDWHSFFFVIGTDWAYRPWSLVTSTLSHAPYDFTHILFNGLVLFFFGPSVERLLGRTKFVGLFFLGGAVAGVIQVHAVSWMEFHTMWSPNTGALGASGALMMIIGILMVLTPKTPIFLLFLPLPLWLGGVLYAVMDIAGVINPDPMHPIGNIAHLSGMALGLAYGFWFRQEMRKKGLRVVY